LIARRIAATVAAALTVAALTASTAGAAVQPGNQTYTNGAQCTSNFIFSDGASTYIGQAAHCSGTGGSTETDGCDSGSLPNGTAVEIEGASQPGTMVYNSWLAMQAANESDAGACAGNDFALVRLSAADAAEVNSSIPFWGGPTGTRTTATTTGEKVLSYGNSSLRLGVRALSPKEGTSLGTSNGGWTHNVYTASPGIPGDSGSAFIDGEGRAFGVLSTLQIAPTAGSNGVADLNRAVQYMRSHGGPAASLVNGSDPFTGPLLPV
jgi:hypothetical protein